MLPLLRPVRTPRQKRQEKKHKTASGKKKKGAYVAHQPATEKRAKRKRAVPPRRATITFRHALLCTRLSALPTA